VLASTIRSTETIELTATADSLAAARLLVDAQVPAGFEITSVMPQMVKGTSDVTLNARARSTQTRELEAVDLEALRTAAPAGWQLMAVRSRP